jgi:two-component system nitrate/nitrite response regulator NarL
MDEVRVLLVADDPLARTGLAALLAERDGCTVVGQVAADDLPTAPDVYRPDVVLWDLGWDSGAVPDGLADLADPGDGGLPVVALLPDAALAPEVWRAGAHGLLPRHVDVGPLLAAMQAVACGLAVFDPVLAGAVPLARSADSPVESLTPREADVLRLLAEGLPNKTIAHRLDISEHTVKFHINAILGKLGAPSRTAAVVQAIRLGLITV